MSSSKAVRVGSRAQVMHGTAVQTSGGLTAKDLVYKNGKIVPKSKSASAKKRWSKMMKDPTFRSKWNSFKRT